MKPLLDKHAGIIPLALLFITFVMFLLCASCSDTPLGVAPPELPEPEIDSFPSWSPDGQTIAYSHYGIVTYDSDTKKATVDPDSTGLWFIAPDGSQRRKVLSGLDINVDWSADGRWIAFEVNAQIYKARVVAGKVDTTSIVQLASEGRNFFPAWGPDGQWIAYDRSVTDASGSSGIWIMRADGSQKQRVFGGSFPDWCPRTRSLIGVIGSSPTSIWTRFVRFHPLDPIPPETLSVVVGANNQFPKYSPGGAMLVFESNAQVWLMDASGGNLRQLTFDAVGRMPDWSPDGNQLVYVGPQHTLWIMDTNGSNQKQLTFRPGRR